MNTSMHLRPQNPIAFWSSRLVWAVLYIYSASYIAAVACLALLLAVTVLAYFISSTAITILSVLCWPPIMLYIVISPAMLILSGIMMYAPTAKLAAFPISIIVVAFALFAMMKTLYVFASPWAEVICGLLFAAYVGTCGYLAFKTARHAMRDIAVKVTTRGPVQLGCGAAHRALPPPEVSP